MLAVLRKSFKVRCKGGWPGQPVIPPPKATILLRRVCRRIKRETEDAADVRDFFRVLFYSICLIRIYSFCDPTMLRLIGRHNGSNAEILPVGP